MASKVSKKLDNWSQYTDQQREQFARQEYENYNVGDPVKGKSKNSSAGYVTKKINNIASGQQSYVIANSPKGTKPKDVKEVAITYRGSSQPLSWDGFLDWRMNDIPAGVRTMTNIKVPTIQMFTSAMTLKQIIKEYPNAKITVYGHSLGSMDGQFALACLSDEELKHIAGGYLYEGPNIYNMLTKSQKRMARKLAKHNVFTYFDNTDIIAFGYGNKNKCIGKSVKVLSYGFLGIVDQHMWGGYMYDLNGKLITNDLQIKRDNMDKFMLAVSMLSPSERIDLVKDGVFEQAEKVAQITADAMNKIAKLYNNEMMECDKDWRGLRVDCDRITTHLSHDEILQSLSDINCTHQTVVTEYHQKYEPKLRTAEKTKAEFDKIKNKLKQSAELITAADNQAGSNF